MIILQCFERVWSEVVPELMRFTEERKKPAFGENDVPHRPHECQCASDDDITVDDVTDDRSSKHSAAFRSIWLSKLIWMVLVPIKRQMCFGIPRNMH